jgi:hypothetical protein
VDLDIVNPYFRSSDSLDYLRSIDVHLLGPVYATDHTNSDSPSLQPGIDVAIEQASPTHAVVFDVGGDPDGCKALARYKPSFAARTGNPACELIYVANLNRPDARTAGDNIALLRAIEAVSGLTATGVLGNTHLKEETTATTVAASLPVLHELCEQTGLPLVGVCSPASVAADVRELLDGQGDKSVPLFSLDTLVKTIWE